MCMRIKSTIDLSALNGYVVQFFFFFKGKHPTERDREKGENSWDKKTSVCLGFY